jgi:acetyl esterase/lipase
VITYDELIADPAPPATRRVRYGDGPLHFGDLWLPGDAGAESDRRTTIVFVHGGCWESEYSLDHAGYAAAALAREGYVVWVPEYRRLGDDGGGWPGTFEDVGAAVDSLASFAGAEPSIDAARVILSGHSAGGQLALWAASRPAAPRSSGMGTTQPPLRPIGVVSLAGITDLAAYSAGSGECNAAVPRLLGGTPARQPDRYRAVSPIDLLPIGVPIALVHGELDPIVPVASMYAFGARAKAAGERISVTTITGAGHFDVIAPRSFAWPTVLAAFEGIRPPL